MMRGDLEAFDALDEYRMVFIEWLSLYKTWLSLDEKYRQLIDRQPVAVPKSQPAKYQIPSRTISRVPSGIIRVQDER